MEKKKSEIPIQENSNNQHPTTWALPDGAIARLGRGREPDISFSPDGKYIGIGTSMGLWLYDSETLSPTALWETARGMVGKIAFSPNGKWIATCNSDCILKVLDVNNGECISKVKTEDYISGLTFSHDNKYISAAHACSSIVEVFHAETCEQFVRLAADPDDAGFYRPLCFSPDDRYILSTYKSAKTPNADAVAVWDVDKCQQVTSLIKHTRWITSLSFSPCGNYLATGGEDGTVYVWDVNTWKQVKEFTDYGDVYGIVPSYTPDGALCAVIDTYVETGPVTISVLNLESGEQLFTDEVWGNTIEFSATADWGNTIVFSNGTHLAYEQRPTYVNLWTSDHPKKRQIIHSPISFPKSATFSHDGKTLAIKHHHEGVVLWDIASRSSRPAIKSITEGKNQFVYKTSKGKFYVASIKDDNVTLWEADGDLPLLNCNGRKYWSAFPTLAPTETLFAYAGEEGKIRVWDVISQTQLYELTHPIEQNDEDDEDDGDKIDKLVFNPDGRLLASETLYGNVILWDMVTEEKIKAFSRDTVFGIIGFSPCGQFLACYGAEIRLWDIKHHKFRPTGLNEGPYGFIEFSPCGRYLVCNGEDKSLHIFDLTRFETHAKIPITKAAERLIAAAFSPCGQYFAAGAWWTEGLETMPIYLWDIEKARHITTFWGHPTDIQDLAISQDNKYLASASYDGSILLWDLSPFL